MCQIGIVYTELEANDLCDFRDPIKLISYLAYAIFEKVKRESILFMVLERRYYLSIHN